MKITQLIQLHAYVFVSLLASKERIRPKVVELKKINEIKVSHLNNFRTFPPTFIATYLTFQLILDKTLEMELKWEIGHLEYADDLRMLTPSVEKAEERRKTGQYHVEILDGNCCR